MQVTIEVPDGLPQELIAKRVKEIEEMLKRDAESMEGKKKESDIFVKNNDPWTNPDIDMHAIDTGREE